jgi:hypothetical protein
MTYKSSIEFRASSIMGIPLPDYIILGFEADEFKEYYSFKQKNQAPNFRSLILIKFLIF